MLHFAPRYGIVSPALIRPSQWAFRHQADNDNAPASRTASDAGAMIADPRVQAALRLFAVHGMAAAERARVAAANANARGDNHDAHWWLAISRLLG